MRRSPHRPAVTICVLLFGDYLPLANRVLGSILHNCSAADYKLVVGANAVCSDTLALIRRLRQQRFIDRLIVSTSNINKCPMMRRMFARIDTEFMWWFDDDSYIQHPRALHSWLKAARSSPSNTVMWGQIAYFNYPDEFANVKDVPAFVRDAKWFRGLPLPSWRPGGKGEFDFQGKGTGDGRWIFLTGGCWLIRTSAVRALDWPDKRLIKMGDDVFLGEAIRQQGWNIAHNGCPDIVCNTEERRGDPG